MTEDRLGTVRTVDLAPDLSDRMALAAGSGREELLPTPELVAAKLAEAGRGDDELLASWVNMAVDLCRTSMEWRRKYSEAVDQGGE